MHTFVCVLNVWHGKEFHISTYLHGNIRVFYLEFCMGAGNTNTTQPSNPVGLECSDSSSVIAIHYIQPLFQLNKYSMMNNGSDSG